MNEEALFNQAKICLEQGDYEQVIALLKTEIEQKPDHFSLYVFLGLAYLLQEQEENAQECWLAGLMGCFIDLDAGKMALKTFLLEETQDLTDQSQNIEALKILRQILNLDSEDLTVHLRYLELACQGEQFSVEDLAELGIIEVLVSWQRVLDNPQLLLDLVLKILQEPTAISLDFLAASIPHLSELDWLSVIMNFANHMAYDRQFISYAIDIAQVCLQNSPNNYYILNDLLKYHRLKEDHQSIVLAATNLWNSIQSQPIDLALHGYFLSHLLSVFLNENDWQIVEQISQKLNLVLEDILIQEKIVINTFLFGRFWALPCPLLYLIDDPLKIRQYFNRNSQLFQEDIQQKQSDSLVVIDKSVQLSPPLSEPLQRIGYIAHTLRKHSVGWLCRWLFKYHNPQDFQIYVYLIGQEADELTEQWIYPNVYRYYHFYREVAEIVTQIRRDKIQVLVDLDVLTHNLTAQVLARKPAPVQVSWLGSDASGLPAIDYFMVDPYVVAQNAQSYYHETLWYLPQTYLAVDGFEVGTPTLSRHNLRFGEQTVIFISVQNKIKSNPRILRLQLQIIQAVSHSIFWIKGGGDNALIREMVEQLAEEIGVDRERVVFLPKDADEMIHRANLGLADVVLDTYPYNGATTTLETLWLGVPLVTRVGEQFAARNSYSFLKQVGIEEGIAWTDEEYVAWGIRFGQDRSLRQQIRERLWGGRQHSPLWQGEQFTREMEKAYGEMWQVHVQGT